MKRKSHSQIKSRLIPVIILFLIIFVAIGYSGYKNHLLKILVSPTSTPVADPTAEWMVYNNLEYNFLFKYPAGLGGQGSISGPTTGTIVGLRSFTDPKTIQTGSNAHFDGFSLYVVTKPSTANFDKYINKEITAMNVAKYTGMRNPTKIQLTNGVALISNDEGQAYYYLPNSDQSEIVVFAYLQSDPSFKQTFGQVLSTFKFTDATSTKVSDCLASTTCKGNTPCMANPAAVFCTCMGGAEKTVNSNTGQSGVCKINGKEYDEWKYFRSFSPSQ